MANDQPEPQEQSIDTRVVALEIKVDLLTEQMTQILEALARLELSK